MSAPTIKPIIIIQPGAMSKRDVKRMNDAGITVVEAKDPQSIRFLDPPRASYAEQERAAISLCRTLLSNGSASTQYYRSTISEMWVAALLNGGALKNMEAVPAVKANP